MSKIDEYRKRWIDAAHKVQTAIATLMNISIYKAVEPKHLRVGIDTQKADQGSLARLLIHKGIFTEEEYLEAIANGMEAEADSYEQEVREKYGNPNIKLM